jgi:ATP-dependent DNA helicase RecQ
LIDRGFRIDEAAAIRGLDRDAVIRHLTWMARRGHRPAVETFLAPETVAAWDDWSASHPDGSPPPEPAEAVPFWPLFRACRTGR